MTSHITVSTSTSPAASGASTGLSSPGKGADALGGFGAILAAVQSVAALPGAVLAGIEGVVPVASGKAAGASAAATGAPAPTGFVQVANDATSASATAAAAARQAASTAASAAARSATVNAGTGVGDSLVATIEKLLNPNAPLDAPADPNTASAPLAATAAVDATAAAPGDAPSDAGTPPKLLKELVASLAALDKAEQSGQPVNQDVLKRVKKAVDAIATFLTAQPQLAPAAAAGGNAGGNNGVGGVTPVGASAAGSAGGTTIAGLPVQPTATDGSAGPDAGSSAPANTAQPTPAPSTNSGTATLQALADARASLKALDGKLADLAAATAGTAPDLSAKLSALAKALDPAAVSPATLSQLGLDATSPSADPALATAISGLANGKPAQPATMQPTLGTPELKLPTGSALGGSDADKPATTGIGHAAGTPTPATAGASSKPTAATQTADKSTPKPDDATTGATVAETRPAPAKPATADKPAAADASAPAADPGSAAAAAAATTVTATTAAPSAAARVAQAAYQAPAVPLALNAPQLAYEIVRHAQQGANHFQIRLDPADLGRVDVSLAIDASGGVNARLTVERPETLDLLRRDSAQLGQALSQAGMDQSRTSLQFSLSQNSSGGQNGAYQQPGSAVASPAVGDSTADTPSVVSPATLYRGTASASGLNIFV